MIENDGNLFHRFREIPYEGGVYENGFPIYYREIVYNRNISSVYDGFRYVPILTSIVQPEIIELVRHDIVIHRMNLPLFIFRMSREMGDSRYNSLFDS